MIVWLNTEDKTYTDKGCGCCASEEPIRDCEQFRLDAKENIDLV